MRMNIYEKICKNSKKGNFFFFIFDCEIAFFPLNSPSNLILVFFAL